MVTSQKCVRAGKYTDNVGYTARHHTFFNAGNFSFGDYFKEDAINYLALLTKELQIAEEKLLVTVYAEDEKPNGKNYGPSDDRIIPIATSDNFGLCIRDHADHVLKYFSITDRKLQVGYPVAPMKMGTDL